LSVFLSPELRLQDLCAVEVLLSGEQHLPSMALRPLERLFRHAQSVIEELYPTGEMPNNPWRWATIPMVRSKAEVCE